MGLIVWAAQKDRIFVLDMCVLVYCYIIIWIYFCDAHMSK